MTSSPTPPLGEFSLQTIDGYLHLVLPAGHFVWENFLGQLNLRLEPGIYQNCGVILTAGNQPIDRGQLDAIILTLGKYQLKLHKVITNNRSTSIVVQPPTALVEPLYLQKIIRSGMVIRHPGSIILRGDVHPGGEVVAGGDILIWGRLKGRAETTNPKGIIMALELDPLQLKIGDRLAVTESSGTLLPEVAYLEKGEIYIVPSTEYKT
jgi:septum site-determining protein MinC